MRHFKMGLKFLFCLLRLSEIAHLKVSFDSTQV